MKNLLRCAIAALAGLTLIPALVFASPVSVNRITNHIEPLTRTDFVKAPYFVSSSTALINLFPNYSASNGTTTIGTSTRWTSTTYCLTGDICINTWPTGGGSTFGQTFNLVGTSPNQYLIPTTTPLSFVINGSSTFNGGYYSPSGTTTKATGTTQYLSQSLSVGSTSIGVDALAVVGNIRQNGSHVQFGSSSPAVECMGCVEYWGNDNTIEGITMAVGNKTRGASSYAGYSIFNSNSNSVTAKFMGIYGNSPVFNDASFGDINNEAGLLALQNVDEGGILIQVSTTSAQFGNIKFATGGALLTNERMRIDVNGGVLIGTTTNFTGGSIPKLAVNGGIFANASSSILSLTMQNSTTTNGTSTAFVMTNGTTTNFRSQNDVWVNATGTSLVLTNGTSTNLLASALTWANATGTALSLTNGSYTNWFATNLTFNNATGTALVITNGTTTNFNTQNEKWANATGTALVITNGSSTNLFGTNLTSTNATSTQLSTTNASSTNSFFALLGTFTNAILAAFTATNGTTTNATSTNMAVTGQFTLPTSTTYISAAMGGLAMIFANNQSPALALGTTTLPNASAYIPIATPRSFMLATTTFGVGSSTEAQYATLSFGETIGTTTCYTDTGTLNVRVGDGTNWSNSLAVSSATSSTKFNFNNTFKKGGAKVIFEVGTAATTPHNLWCSYERTFVNI